MATRVVLVTLLHKRGTRTCAYPRCTNVDVRDFIGTEAEIEAEATRWVRLVDNSWGGKYCLEHAEEMESASRD